ncbi:MAG: alpha/beta hydrolase [Gammaproteobacteria bacterium]|nr:alpha/beta hydrolase [Gammaproteobacteria bacterium]
MRDLFKKFTLIFCLSTLLLSYSFALSPQSSGYIPVKQGKLYYEKYGSGTPILVLHGGPGSGLDHGYFKPQLLSLAANYEVIFYDQRGSGKSLETGMNRDVINLQQFTDDIETVRKTLGFKQFILLGHSWGSLLALNYSIKYPNHAAKLILIDSMPANLSGKMAAANALNQRIEPFKNEIAPLSDYNELQKLTAEQIIALTRKLFSVYFYKPEDAEKLTLDITVESSLSGFKVAQLMMQDMFDNLLPQLNKLNVPTTIIHGEQDFVPLWTAQDLAKAIPNAKLIVVSQSGHFPFIEKPDEFFNTI